MGCGFQLRHFQYEGTVSMHEKKLLSSHFTISFIIILSGFFPRTATVDTMSYAYIVDTPNKFQNAR